jgi:hypothetical protein
LSEKEKENELLKKRILMFRTQLRQKVSYLRRFENLSQPSGISSISTTFDKEYILRAHAKQILEKDQIIADLQNQILDRDQLIAQQVSYFFQLNYFD